MLGQEYLEAWTEIISPWTRGVSIPLLTQAKSPSQIVSTL